MTSTAARHRCDVFCRVVDNFGDAAVCWRLARSLAAEHAFRVRLWIDRPEVLAALQPALDATVDRQSLEDVEVCHLRSLRSEVELPDIAIDAFGHGLPDAYAAALAGRRPRALWIVLEYLSAEDWAAGVHRLASPHPALDIRRYFFCPGFDPDSGGLLREAGLVESRQAFEADAGAHARLRAGAGGGSTSGSTSVSTSGSPIDRATQVSLFGYDNPGLPGLLQSMAAGPSPVRLALAPGVLADAAAGWFAAVGRARQAGRSAAAYEAFEVRHYARAGALEAHWLPFLPQPDYDRLLWASDFNFVRGEDSLARGVWAARPLCWQLYPQQDDAQCPKLEAFIETVGRLSADAVGPTGDPVHDETGQVTRDSAWAALQRAWNGCGLPAAQRPDAVAAAWRDVQAGLPVLQRRATRLAAQLAGTPDLAARLAGFCRDQLK